MMSRVHGPDAVPSKPWRLIVLMPTSFATKCLNSIVFQWSHDDCLECKRTPQSIPFLWQYLLFYSEFQLAVDKHHEKRKICEIIHSYQFYLKLVQILMVVRQWQDTLQRYLAFQWHPEENIGCLQVIKYINKIF